MGKIYIVPGVQKDIDLCSSKHPKLFLIIMNSKLQALEGQEKESHLLDHVPV